MVFIAAKLLPTAIMMAMKTPGNSMGYRFPDYHFPVSSLEPPAFGNLQALPHGDADRCKTADRHVHAVRRIHARQVDDRHHFERSHWLAVFSAGDARFELEVLKL